MLADLNMEYVVVILLTATIQSLFGVGVLLFGTPLLLLLGYQFLDILLILLPISASINLFQILRSYKYIQFEIYKNILLYSIPFIILFLYLISKIHININFLVGLFIIFIALKDHIPIFNFFLKKLLTYNKIFYISMGIIHGMTNLGGALLTAKIFHTNLKKYQTRATIAISYMTFALFQIATILLLNVNYKRENFLYVGIGLLTYFIVNRFLFHKISDHRYEKLFSLFLIFSGILLVSKGLIW